MFHRFQALLGRMAVFFLGLLSFAQAIAADWMINEDYYQTDTRAATDFEFLLSGDVAAQITSGGQTSITNAFAYPTRSTSLQPGFNNPIVRFAGSNTIPTTPTTKRHFGIFGTGKKPTVLTKAWSFPTAPFRVPVPKSNFDFAYDPQNDTLRITLENTSPYTVTFQNVGYTISSTEYPIDQLPASGLPLSVFLPLTGSTLSDCISISFQKHGSLLSISRIHCLLPSPMPINDGCCEVFVGDDLRGQLVTHDFHQIATGEQSGRITMRKTLLGQKYGRDHHQRHVVVPRRPTAHLILGHAAGALGFLEGLLDEMTRPLHFRQAAQGSRRLGIGQAEFERFPVQFPADQKMPAAGRRLLSIPDPYAPGQIVSHHFALLPGSDR